jgi:hypothetical protein
LENQNIVKNLWEQVKTKGPKQNSLNWLRLPMPEGDCCLGKIIEQFVVIYITVCQGKQK